MAIALADVAIIVNNEPISIVPNSCKFTEGFGTQTMRAASAGGGSVEQVFSNNIEESFSMISFDLYNDIDSINNSRSWKANRNQNIVEMTGKTPDGKNISRTFSQAAILNNYEIELGSDTQFTIEFSSNPAV